MTSADPRHGATARCRALRTIAIALAMTLASACSQAPVRHNPLAQWVPSPNHNARQPVLVVIHATTQRSAEASLHTLRTRNSGGPVSAHYLIGRDGALYQLVDEERRAWHAGPGSWGTIGDVNSASIGIELDNDGEEPFAEAQIAKLLVLLKDVCARLGIPPQQVIAHADLAPTRKTDPGARFPWQRLAQAGFGRWPAPDAGLPPPDFDAVAALRQLGYPVEDLPATLRAFRLHYRALDSEGPVEAEDLRVLHGLIATLPGQTPAPSAPANESGD